MPSRRRKRGGYRDVAHPLNNETRRMIEEQVLAEYQRALGAAAAGVRLAPHDDDHIDEEGGWHEPPPAIIVTPIPPAAASTPVAEVPEDRKSLEEVEKLHLGDSFWS